MQPCPEEEPFLLNIIGWYWPVGDPGLEIAFSCEPYTLCLECCITTIDSYCEVRLTVLIIQ